MVLLGPVAVSEYDLLSEEQWVHLEVAEERVHHEVEQDEWRKRGVDESHKDKPPLEPVVSLFRVSPHRQIPAGQTRKERDARLGQVGLVPLAHERPSDLAVRSKQEANEAKAQVPFERPREHRRAISGRARSEALHELGNGDGEIEYVFVDERDEVILLAHDPVRDVVRVEPLRCRWVVRGRERGRVRGAQLGEARDDRVPRDRLDVVLRALELVEEGHGDGRARTSGTSSSSA